MEELTFVLLYLLLSVTNYQSQGVVQAKINRPGTEIAIWK